MDNLPSVGFVAVCLIFGIPVVAMIGYYGHEAWKTWLEIGLKRDMVVNGFTAQEIVEVLATGKTANGDASLRDGSPAKPIKQPAL